MEKQILIIDDDKLITKSLQKLLKKEGFITTLASSGQEALGLAAAQEFDLIISDVKMPGMDGIETLKRLREARAGAGKPPVPEIVITGYAEESSLKSAMDMKVAGFIYKPFNTDEFIATVKKNLS